jgi:restriction system protein
LQKITWQEQIIEELQTISPDSFERLCQRLLRELGFQNVEVTRQSNDGGIDGKGIIKTWRRVIVPCYFSGKALQK